MAKIKYYVVWKGRQTGLFDTWEACNAQIKGFAGAQYKSFASKALAEQALAGSSSDFIGKNFLDSPLSEAERILIGDPVEDSIAVDAAWNTFTRAVEYRGVHTTTGKEIFRQGPYDNGTINIGEFLAIVHALALCKKNNWSLPIYSDSRNATGGCRIKRRVPTWNATKTMRQFSIWSLARCNG